MEERQLDAPSRAVENTEPSDMPAEDADLLDPAGLLCHYTRADTAFEHILPTGRLRMNPYAQMRDPFENKHPSFWLPKGGLFEGDNQSLCNQISNSVGSIREGIRLLSLTQGDEREGTARELPFRCPWARPRMWEQYADNHRGVCLVFDREELLKSIRAKLDGDCWEGPVRYTLAGFPHSPGAEIDLDRFRRDHLREDVERHIEQHHRDLFFLKTEDWASEAEYRIVCKTRPDPMQWPAAPIDVAYAGALRYVIANIERFPRWHIPGAIRQIRESGAKFRTMDWNSGRPYPGWLVGVSN